MTRKLDRIPFQDLNNLLECHAYPDWRQDRFFIALFYLYIGIVSSSVHFDFNRNQNNFCLNKIYAS